MCHLFGVRSLYKKVSDKIIFRLVAKTNRNQQCIMRFSQSSNEQLKPPVRQKNQTGKAKRRSEKLSWRAAILSISNVATSLIARDAPFKLRISV